jgi:hypothetical protein
MRYNCLSEDEHRGTAWTGPMTRTVLGEPGQAGGGRCCTHERSWQLHNAGNSAEARQRLVCASGSQLCSGASPIFVRNHEKSRNAALSHTRCMDGAPRSDPEGRATPVDSG